MANYDQFAAAVKELSGGKNVVLLDDLGLPSVYVPINKLKNSEIIKNGTENTHPAFSVNGVEKSRFLYSKYQNTIINGRAYSLAHRDPKTGVTFDAARQACEAKGTGFHIGTLAEWAAVALLTRKMGTMPHGNNNYGSDSAYPYEKGQESYRADGKTARTFTGSGPATWGHDHTQFGIQDMKGNEWEWLGGMRMNDGEIQIIPYNNAAMGSGCDMSATSTLWKAIKSDGTVVDPGTAGTLKYDYLSSKITLISGTVTDTGDAGRSYPYASLGLETDLTVPELAKALILYPDEPGGDYGGDYRWANMARERLPFAGGDWVSASGGGVLALILSAARSYSGGNVGFRSAYVELQSAI